MKATITLLDRLEKERLECIFGPVEALVVPAAPIARVMDARLTDTRREVEITVELEDRRVLRYRFGPGQVSVHEGRPGDEGFRLLGLKPPGATLSGWPHEDDIWSNVRVVTGDPKPVDDPFSSGRISR